MQKSRRSLALLGLIFLLPVLFSTAYFLYVKHFGSFEQTNYGTLINPVISLNRSMLLLSDIYAKPVNNILPKKWTLTYINHASSCEAKCVQTLKVLLRIRDLLNEDVRRVQVLLVSAFPDLYFQSESALMKKILLMDKSNGVFSSIKNGQSSKADVVMLDPLGNVFIRYPYQKIDIKKTIKDLKRLLKYSRIG